MADPHNPTRYGETWPQDRINACLCELESIKLWVIISGGWAWHFMSPKGHVELKHAHDHKDIDIFVKPENVALVVSTLKHRGFEKVQTKYDRLPSEEDFRRYEKIVEVDNKRPVRITIDFFVREDIPHRDIDGWMVVEPRFLLSLYSNIHTSDKCFAVQAAVKLIENGIDPEGREELLQIPAR
ncbi:MAG: hypothetical protein F6K10_04360 [Moorea sp. SIO2B7]|nr:hypothetical protein [Moorena sp. SIO2B7]